MSVNDSRLAFLQREFFAWSFIAASQRGRIYSSIATQNDSLALRVTLRDALDAELLRYGRAVSDQDHVALIARVADEVSRAHPGMLRDERFRIGSAQKLLNLYLKYQWCAGLIPAPPHCPFDRIVLQRLPGCREHNWTQTDDVSTYKTWVDAAKLAAGGQSLPEWELSLYNNTRSTTPA